MVRRTILSQVPSSSELALYRGSGTSKEKEKEGTQKDVGGGRLLAEFNEIQFAGSKTTTARRRALKLRKQNAVPQNRKVKLNTLRSIAPDSGGGMSVLNRNHFLHKGKEGRRLASKD